MIAVLKTLADDTRFEILIVTIVNGFVNTSLLTEKIGIPKVTLRHHLDILVGADVLIKERRGRDNLYFINWVTLMNLVYWLRKTFRMSDRSESGKEQECITIDSRV